MSIEYRTRELARIYESQGYFQDALDILAALDKDANGEDPDLKTAVSRLENALANAVVSEVPDQEQGRGQDRDWNQDQDRVARHLEQWLKLLILEKRLVQFRKIQARLQ